MTPEQAEKILKKSYEYFRLDGDGIAVVDGAFMANELEAIACLLRLKASCRSRMNYAGTGLKWTSRS